MAATPKLCLSTLVSASVFLARRGGHIIKEVHRQGQLGAHNKKLEGDERSAETMNPSEVLTIADTRCQNAIVSSFRTMFPGIRLVGEEDEGSGPPEEPTLLEEVPPLSAPVVATAELAEALTLADTCLWVDPLDGTIEFVRGNLHNVCVLIGIAVRDRPVAGVVHQPFVGGEDGTTTYGALGAGVFGDRSPAFGEAPLSELVIGMEPKHAENARLQAATRRLRGASPTLSQGCGQNLLKVLRGENSLFLQQAGASRWDTCAGEALLMAVGGKVTDLDGNPYQYEQGVSSYVNDRGLIAARTMELHQRAALACAPDAEPAEADAAEQVEAAS